jgi:oligogalacturonide lyase
MKEKPVSFFAIVFACTVFTSVAAIAQIGTRFPSEKKYITDPITGTKLTFLTTKLAGDSKIYQTHNQWTSDGRIIPVPGEWLTRKY